MLGAHLKLDVHDALTPDPGTEACSLPRTTRETQTVADGRVSMRSQSYAVGVITRQWEMGQRHGLLTTMNAAKAVRSAAIPHLMEVLQVNER